MKKHSVQIAALVAVTISFSGCSTPGQNTPDKTIIRSATDTTFGAGAGAIIGNQVGASGAGIAIGAGLGLLHGAIQGAVSDSIDDKQAEQEKALASIKAQNETTRRDLKQLQTSLDSALATHTFGGSFQVYFEEDATNLKAGSVTSLESVADSIKGSPAPWIVTVIGHSDDSGISDHATQVAETRARNVAAYLAGRGISMDRIKVKNYGSERPIASNSTPVGRQLNRRVEILLGMK